MLKPYVMKNLKLIIALLVCTTFSNAQSLEKAWETEKTLKIPESVLYDGIRDQIYVSNINGKPKIKDGNGFISLLDKDGNIKNLKWVTGLDGPCGMAILNDSLFVTDIDRVHIISISKSEIIQTIEVKGASFLNDIVVFDDAVAFITDLHAENIVRLENGKTEIWLSDEMIVKPDGLAFYGNSLAVGGKNSILIIDVKSKNIELLIDETGPVDGLIYLGDNKFIISDWAGKIFLVDPYKKIILSNSTEKKIQAADLGYIVSDKEVLIPTFYDNRVIAVKYIDPEKGIQTNTAERSQFERDLIKDAVEQFYIKGLKERDFSLIRTICINESKLYGVRKDSSLNVTSLDQWSNKFDPQNPPFKSLDYKIKKIDFEGTAAQVKILFIINGNTEIHDFLNLLKIEGQWRIVNIIDF